MLRDIFYKVSLHCWGGLGSQLFAWALAEQLRIKFPKKRIQIVFHTSGVTKRLPEITFLSTKFELVYKNDYVRKPLTTDFGHQKKLTIKNSLKTLLDFLRIINSSDRSTSISQIKPWTCSLRGHYSNNDVPLMIIEQMKLKINEVKASITNTNDRSSNTLGIHYRLGDLLHLENKSFISPEVIGSVVKNLLKSKKINRVVIYSDAINESKKYLQGYLPEDTEYFDSSVWDTLLILCKNKYFIGSNSKISIWITLFQHSQVKDSQSWLPQSMGRNINNQFYGVFDFEQIHLY
jgi:hypothetical protein